MNNPFPETQELKSQATSDLVKTRKSPLERDPVGTRRLSYYTYLFSNLFQRFQASAQADEHRSVSRLRGGLPQFNFALAAGAGARIHALDGAHLAPVVDVKQLPLLEPLEPAHVQKRRVGKDATAGRGRAHFNARPKRGGGDDEAAKT